MNKVFFIFFVCFFFLKNIFSKENFDISYQHNENGFMKRNSRIFTQKPTSLQTCSGIIYKIEIFRKVRYWHYYGPRFPNIANGWSLLQTARLFFSNDCRNFQPLGWWKTKLSDQKHYSHSTKLIRLNASFEKLLSSLIRALYLTSNRSIHETNIYND